MKKILSLFAFIITSTNVYCQSVLGIPFGSSYDVVKNSLENRFGKYEIHESGGDINVYDIHIGDYKFDYGTFSFQRASGLSFFNYAFFQDYYDLNSVETAKRNLDYLFSLLREKYEDDYLGEYKNDQGFKCYKFGTDPTDKSKVLGNITLSRSKGKDGITRLYIILTYGPMHYIDKSADF
jgi:hypothetical protein